MDYNQEDVILKITLLTTRVKVPSSALKQAFRKSFKLLSLANDWKGHFVTPEEKEKERRLCSAITEHSEFIWLQSKSCRVAISYY